MIGWHHWLSGHEFEQTLGDGEGQGSLACCSPWGHKESDMTDWLNSNNPCHTLTFFCQSPSLRILAFNLPLGWDRKLDPSWVGSGVTSQPWYTIPGPPWSSPPRLPLTSSSAHPLLLRDPHFQCQLFEQYSDPAPWSWGSSVATQMMWRSSPSQGDRNYPRDTKGTFHAKIGLIKDRNGIDLTEAEDIKKRWQEYTEELYKNDLHNPDNHNGVITHLEPDILECEVKWALESITMNKASGGDGIPVELFQTLKDDAVKVLHAICQQV